MRLAAAVLALTSFAGSASRIAASAQGTPPGGTAHTYLVFVQARQIGQEAVTVARDAGGWVVHGSNRLAPPIDVAMRAAEIRYDESWHPTHMTLSGVIRGQEASIKTTFANGQAVSEIDMKDTPPSKTDQVSSDTIVLPNAFLGSYAVLARRLVGQEKGAVLRTYIAPQAEIAMQLEAVIQERIETPKAAIPATRYALVVSNPPPAGAVRMNVWTDAEGTLLRLSVPAQMLEIAREDVASAATRTTAFSIPGDENVRIPASGFGLAASVAKPANAQGPLPAIIVIGGSGPIDRDGTVAGIPVLGQIAADLVNAGFLVVRYDKRGVGQSGGRSETTTISDYAEDVRAVISWLDDRRKDVDKKRIGLVGHSEGAWIALTAAARDKRVGAVALIGGVSTSGSELVLEQQRHELDRMKASDADRQAKIALQQQINDAAIKGIGWDAIPPDLRRVADSPWFQSFLAFDPVKVMKDVRQPILIVQGELDRQVDAHHADRLAELARGRKRKAAVDVVKVPGVNHLLVPAQTGEVDEYGMLTEKKVAPAATSAISTWMTKELAPAKK
jgi:pimeloyl-ACP methyl ester carboxylesterase